MPNVKVKFGHTCYNLTLLDACKMRFALLWFPVRRFLRAAKRTLKNLGLLGMTFFIFLPIAGVLLGALTCFGLFDFVESIKELVLIILGSFVLLAVRETLEFEKLRKARLLKQERVCWTARIQFSNYINAVFDLLNVQHRYRIFMPNNTELNGVLHQLEEVLKEEQNDVLAEEKDYFSVAKIAQNTRDHCIELRSFVSESSIEGGSYEHLSECLVGIIDDLVIPLGWRGVPDRKVYAENTIKILREMSNFIIIMRRPWYLTMDKEREETIRNKYEQYKIQWP